MSTHRYAVLGLAGVRAVWFREVGRWSTAAAIPVDFVKCVSTEELRARLAGGRAFSALLIDAGTTGLDRDLIDAARETGAAVLVVSDGRSARDWVGLGATAVLPEDFHRGELVDELERHGRPLDHGEADAPVGAGVPQTSWSGRLVAVTGGAGAGSSVLAMALAQGLAADPRHTDLTLLADMALDADLAMLHDARDVIPGLQEMVDAHRTGTPGLADIRSMVFDTEARGYHLLLGLRRHRDWAFLRQRAVISTLEGLLRSYRMVVADIDADIEGEDETGSVDVEERNVLARSTVQRADLVVAVGRSTMKGLHDLLRVTSDLIGFGVEPVRILPVLNMAGRPGRSRAELTAALGELLAPISPEIPTPIHVPERRRLEEVLRDNVPLPQTLTQPIAAAVAGVVDHLGPRPGAVTEPEPVAVAPGSIGHFFDDEDAG
ncbi:MAG: hypothetical protein AAF480_01985 [Actinomycetota bacterium]